MTGDKHARRKLTESHLSFSRSALFNCNDKASLYMDPDVLKTFISVCCECLYIYILFAAMLSSMHLASCRKHSLGVM